MFCMLFLSLHNQKRFSALFIHIFYLDLEYDNLFLKITLKITKGKYKKTFTLKIIK